MNNNDKENFHSIELDDNPACRLSEILDFNGKFLNYINKPELKQTDDNSTIAKLKSCEILISDMKHSLMSYKLNEAKTSLAYDFRHFMSDACILINSIIQLKIILSIKRRQPEERIFVKSAKAKESKSDWDYWRFLRVTTFAHTAEFDNDKIKLGDENFSTPFLCWDNSSKKDPKGELYLGCLNHKGEFFNAQYLDIHEVFEFIKYMYNQINIICDALETCLENIIQKFIMKKIKPKSCNETKMQYLERLELAAFERTELDHCYFQKPYALLLSKFKNKRNSKMINWYINIWEYALNDFREKLQIMKPDDSRLFFELQSPLNNVNIPKIVMQEYEVCSEIPDFIPEEVTKYYKHLINFCSKYVNFKKEADSTAIYALINIALCQYAIENNCRIKNLIPDFLLNPHPSILRLIKNFFIKQL